MDFIYTVVQMSETHQRKCFYFAQAHTCLDVCSTVKLQEKTDILMCAVGPLAVALRMKCTHLG